MYKIILAVFFSSLAALGTLPYGYRFSEYYFNDPFLQIPFGIIFAITGTSANAILGTFSLLKIKQGPIKYPHSLSLLIVCILSAIPMGCICFFGFQSILPIQINIIASVVVTIVNTAINFTAIQFFIKDILTASKNKNRLSFNPLKSIVNGLGYLIGVLVALAPFLAATAGANDFLLHYDLRSFYNNKIGTFIGILSFIPLACLYSYTNKNILNNIFSSLEKGISKGINFNLFFIFIIIFCLLSGTALAQIMREFFSPDKNIPELFKTEFMQLISANLLVPLAGLSSAATSFFCLNDLIKNKLN